MHPLWFKVDVDKAILKISIMLMQSFVLNLNQSYNRFCFELNFNFYQKLKTNLSFLSFSALIGVDFDKMLQIMMICKYLARFEF